MSLLGVYFCPEHGRSSDLAYMTALQPPWVRILDPGVNHIAQVQGASHSARVMLRYWWLDDGSRQQMAAMAADPIATARRHADEWAREMDRLEQEARQQGLPVNRGLWWGGALNEPDPNYGAQLRDYSGELMRRGMAHGNRFGVLVFSVGNPGKPGEGQFDWNFYKALESDIHAGGHVVILHEYWQPEGVRFTWTDTQGHQRIDEGNLAWRHHHCPLNVPILIGECGANGYLYNRHSSEDNAGWQRFMEAEQYAAQVEEYARGCDERVVGILPFLTDYRSNQWASFDTAPAHAHLLARKDAMIPQVRPSTPPASKPVDTHLPNIIAPAQPVTVPTPADNWARSIAFVRRWEGGFVNDPHDPGGATNKGITIGTYTRWRQAHGQPQPTVAELRVIDDAEVEQIYREWYWLASGADKLPWPLCLAHFDTAVNAGPGRAGEMLQKSNGNFLAYMGHLIEFYAKINTFATFGKAWMLRRADLLKEAAKG